MKIIAIILVVAIIGFAIFKISKKKKARQSVYKGPAKPKKTTTPIRTASTGYDANGKPVKLPNETPDEFAERERAWAHSTGYYSGKRSSDYYSGKR